MPAKNRRRITAIIIAHAIPVIGTWVLKGLH
jgi:hypothetical protein